MCSQESVGQRGLSCRTGLRHPAVLGATPAARPSPHCIAKLASQAAHLEVDQQLGIHSRHIPDLHNVWPLARL